MNSETIALVVPALVVGAMMTSVLVPLGEVVLKRGIIFIDLAVAQVASLGFVAALFLHIHDVYLTQGLALLLALGTAFLFKLIESRYSRYLEAFIGITYVFSATLALLLLSYHPQGAEHFKGLLSGELLFVSWDKILMHLPVYVIVGVIWKLLPSARAGLLFYLIFGLVITSAVQLVGVFLVFTLLICPALMMAIGNKKLSFAYLVTIVAFGLGIIISILTDSPTSPTVILSITTLCLIVTMSSSIPDK